MRAVWQDAKFGLRVLRQNPAFTAIPSYSNQNPLGKHLANSRDQIQRMVVGVVANVKFNALTVTD